MTASPNQIATAYHEAGHAVLALYLGRAIQRVSILPSHLRMGQCDIQKGSFRPSKDLLETEILILLGGVAAEARQTGHYDWGGASQDLRGIRRLSQMRAGGPKQMERLERRMLDKVEHLLGDEGHWQAVKLIAAELLKLGTISGRAAKHYFEMGNKI